MGFATGFTGGVTLTLSLAYLAVLTHHRNRVAQGESLRSTALTINSLIDPIPQPLPPTRSEVAAAQTATSIEVAKDKWNSEIMNAVRWVQGTDWNEVREGMEETVSELWRKAYGATPSETAEESRKSLEDRTKRLREEASSRTRDVKEAAKGAWQTTKDKGEQIQLSAEDKALEARLKGKQSLRTAENKIEEKAGDAKGFIASAFEKGRETASNLVVKARQTIGLADEKLEQATSFGVLPATNPVQKALNERYQRPEAKVNKTIAEVLKERYTPIDQRDNTVLRGL